MSPIGIARGKALAVAEVDRHAQALVAISHAIHKDPELGLEEHRAVRRLSEFLGSNGVQVQVGAYGLETAFVARAGELGPPVALLCEYDALKGKGHACGHNVIAAAGVGAGLAAAQLAKICEGRIVILGTPAEETHGGKVTMIRNGAFTGISAALMVHPGDADCAMPPTLALRDYNVRYRGKAAHAAKAPWAGRNALDAAVLGYSAVAALRQHIKPDERVHGVFVEGGETANVVPDKASMHWIVRSGTRVRLDDLDKQVRACLRSGALASGCSCKFEGGDNPYNEVRHNVPLAEAWAKNMKYLGRELMAPDQYGGSTDMGNVSYVVPAIHPHIQTAAPGTKIHEVAFERAAVGELADKAVVDGAKALAMTVIDIWLNPSVRKSVKRAFEAAGGPDLSRAPLRARSGEPEHRQV